MPLAIDGMSLAYFQRSQPAIALDGRVAVVVGVHLAAVRRSLQHGIHIRTRGILPRAIGAEIAVLQAVAAGATALCTADDAIDAHMAFELADIQTHLEALVGMQVVTDLKAIEVARCLRGHGAGLTHAGIGAQHPAPGAALIARGPVVIAHAFVQVTQHGQIALKQLGRQRRYK